MEECKKPFSPQTLINITIMDLIKQVFLTPFLEHLPIYKAFKYIWRFHRESKKFNIRSSERIKFNQCHT